MEQFERQHLIEFNTARSRVPGECRRSLPRIEGREQYSLAGVIPVYQLACRCGGAPFFDVEVEADIGERL